MKILIPLSIVWILLIATIRAWRNNTHNEVVYGVTGFVLVLVVVLAWAWDNGAQRHAARLAGEYDEPVEAGGGERGAGSFPVPPLDLPHYHGIGVAAQSITGDGGPGTASGATKEVTGA